MGKHFSEKQVRNVIEYFAEHRGQENAVTIEQVAHLFLTEREVQSLKEPGRRAWRLIEKVRWYVDQMGMPIFATYCDHLGTVGYYVASNEYEHDLGQTPLLKNLDTRLKHFQVNEERAATQFPERETVNVYEAVGIVGQAKALLKRGIDIWRRARGLAS